MYKFQNINLDEYPNQNNFYLFFSNKKINNIVDYLNWFNSSNWSYESGPTIILKASLINNNELVIHEGLFIDEFKQKINIKKKISKSITLVNNNISHTLNTWFCNYTNGKIDLVSSPLNQDQESNMFCRKNKSPNNKSVKKNDVVVEKKCCCSGK